MRTYLTRLMQLCRKERRADTADQYADEAIELFADCLESAELDPLDWIINPDLDGPLGAFFIDSDVTQDPGSNPVFSFWVDGTGKLTTLQWMGDNAKALAPRYEDELRKALAQPMPRRTA